MGRGCTPAKIVRGVSTNLCVKGLRICGFDVGGALAGEGEVIGVGEV